MVLYCATTVEEGSVFRNICKDMNMQILLTIKGHAHGIKTELKND